MSEPKVYQNEERQKAFYEYGKKLPTGAMQSEEVGDRLREFNEQRCDPPLTDDEIAPVFMRLCELWGDENYKNNIKARLHRYEMVRIGNRYHALDKAALKEGELVAYNRTNFLEGPGNLTFDVHKDETKVSKDKKGNEVKTTTEQTRTISAGLEWWNERCKEQPLKIAFRPGEKQNREGEINTWQGWGVNPSPEGSCVRFHMHLLDNVCQGNTDHYKYLWDCLCHMFQHPMERHGVAIAIGGEQGVGKSFIGEQVLAPLLGNAYYAIGDSKVLENSFNDWLNGRLLVHFDEAFFSGEHRVRSLLKNLITSKKLHINAKNLPTFQIDNYAHILITSNAGWIVPAEEKDRRYFVLICGSDHANDRPYFKAIIEELENGGYARLLYELLNTKITSDWSRIPTTEAKVEQIEEGLDPVKTWWRDSLEHYAEDDKQEPKQDPIYAHVGEDITATEASIRFQRWAKRFTPHGRMPKGAGGMGKFLTKVCGERVPRGSGANTYYVYEVKQMTDDRLNSGQSEKQMDENLNEAKTDPSSVDLSSPPPAEALSPETESPHGRMSEMGWANLRAERERLKAQSDALKSQAEPQLPEYTFDLFTPEEKPGIMAAFERIYKRPASRVELDSVDADEFLDMAREAGIEEEKYEKPIMAIARRDSQRKYHQWCRRADQQQRVAV